MKINNFLNSLNIYLLIITVFCIILITFLTIYYIYEENIVVQKYLQNTYKNLNRLERKIMINSNYKLKKMHNIIIIDNILTQDYFHYIKNQFNNKTFKSTNIYIKKALGINFFDLHKKEYKGLVELYYSNTFLNVISDSVHKSIQRVPLSDPNACSLLTYTSKGDGINWHTDHSNFYGDRFVVLLTIVNENATKDGLSQNEFHYKYKNKIYKYKMKENSLVIFKGSDIWHKATTIEKDERRILLSMVYCDIRQTNNNIFNLIHEKVKNYITYN
jgi:hypothetical protein